MSGIGSPSRSWLLVGGAIVAAAVLVGVYLAAGGASYAPQKAQDPCDPRQWRDPGNLQEVAEQFSLSALDGAACELGVTREELARALESPESRERFAERLGIGDEELAEAVRAGLIRAVDDAEEAGALSPFLAGPLRRTLERLPLEQAIDLIDDASGLLEDAEGLLGPAQELLEDFFQ